MNSLRRRPSVGTATDRADRVLSAVAWLRDVSPEDGAAAIAAVLGDAYALALAASLIAAGMAPTEANRELADVAALAIELIAVPEEE